MSSEMVAIDGVTKRFGTFEAVADAAFTLDRGKFLTIVGPSGCGKTTLLRMLAGFERPSAGSIRINGDDVSAVPAHKRAIGMVFQRLALFPHMTAAENIAYPMRRRGHPKAEIGPRVAEMLDLVRLPGLGDRRPHELSGGQQQRIAIARALSFRPDLLLLDEPLSALDKKLREDMQLEFRRIQQDLGVTTINVTHDQREALVMSDKIVVMNEGRIQQTDTPHTLYHAPKTRFVATFLGVTSMLPGKVEKADGESLCVRIGETTLLARGAADAGAEVDCAVRAEHVTIVAGDGPLGLDNELHGRVAQVVFEGERTALIVDVSALGGPSVQAFDLDPASHAPFSVGDPVTVGFDKAHLFAFPK
ncbi:ABC transporter ATP-binding protein [Acuticoccus sp. MNP-M23]|uniref:ABC transporter ATP-binding protein n=1 Tax=Acuticoccus sp. MNP-M23 TaxID=3072793 RepID=UPI002815DF5E|nr:ABC transporter ATP-binding protein [Acuticoccus sp. MNP-M23]WMS43713.1 ABC transporter ATP-binding protein [Acuticoccus sp. MNP-M23]